MDHSGSHLQPEVYDRNHKQELPSRCLAKSKRRRPMQQELVRTQPHSHHVARKIRTNDCVQNQRGPAGRPSSRGTGLGEACGKARSQGGHTLDACAYNTCNTKWSKWLKIPMPHVLSRLSNLRISKKPGLGWSDAGVGIGILKGFGVFLGNP